MRVPWRQPEYPGKSTGGGSVYEYQVYSDGEVPLAATITWTNPPGMPSNSVELNPVDLKLVNDLDLRIIYQDGTIYEPFILDPANPAFCLNYFQINAMTGKDYYQQEIEILIIGATQIKVNYYAARYPFKKNDQLENECFKQSGTI